MDPRSHWAEDHSRGSGQRIRLLASRTLHQRRHARRITLTPKEQRAIALRREGKTVAETAKALRISPERVERIGQYAMHKLVTRLRPRVFDGNQWFADKFLRRAPGATEADFVALLPQLPAAQRSAIEGLWQRKSLDEVALASNVEKDKITDRFSNGRIRLLELWERQKAVKSAQSAQ